MAYGSGIVKMSHLWYIIYMNTTMPGGEGNVGSDDIHEERKPQLGDTEEIPKIAPLEVINAFKAKLAVLLQYVQGHAHADKPELNTEEAHKLITLLESQTSQHLEDPRVRQIRFVLEHVVKPFMAAQQWLKDGDGISAKLKDAFAFLQNNGGKDLEMTELNGLVPGRIIAVHTQLKNLLGE